MTAIEPGIRIGELGQRVGLSTHALRAWERRYALLTPMRSASGYRLYGSEDERRVRAMVALCKQGLPASQAAAKILADKDIEVSDLELKSSAPAVHVNTFTSAIYAALARFDEPAADAAIDRLLAAVSLTSAVDDAIMPFLTSLGLRWEEGSVSIAQEHFITAVLRRRFAALTLPRGKAGPLAVLAAPEGEHHDLPLAMFAALLSRAGWRVRQLGANTPVCEIASASADAQLVVVATRSRAMFRRDASDLAKLAAQRPLALAGGGATDDEARACGAHSLPNRLGDAVAAAGRLIK